MEISGGDIVFKIPKTMGFIGRQKSFNLQWSNVVIVGNLSTWFWDDEAEILVIIDKYSNEYDSNIKYFDDDFYETLTRYTDINFGESIAELRRMLNKSAILYSKTQRLLTDGVIEIKWTVGSLSKSILSTFSSKNSLFVFLEMIYSAT